MPSPAGESAITRVTTLAQLATRGSWQLELAHDRPHALFIWLTRGQGLALIDGIRRGIGAHNALYIPAGALMSLDLGRQGFGHALTLPDTSGMNLPQRPVHLRLREAPAQMELNGLLDSMMREQAAARPMLETAMSAHAALVAVWLHRQMTRPGPELVSDTPAHRILRAFAERITRPDSDHFSLEDHAAAIDVTPTHLARVCKAETGRTAATLITERRLHRARTLLAETEMPVQDIARSLGFASAAYFTRFIQQHCGASPSALRRGPVRPTLQTAVVTSAPQKARVAFGPGSGETKH